MRFNFSNTVYSGPLAGFPHAARALAEAFPCWRPVLHALDVPSELPARRHWAEHVLRQLSFSYLKQEYLASTVSEVLAELPPGGELIPALDELRRHVRDLAAGRERMSDATMATLNGVAADLVTDLHNHQVQRLSQSMNNLGRWLFSGAENSKKVEQWLLWAAIATQPHVDVDAFLTLLREMVAGLPFASDARTLKAAALAGLTGIRDELAISAEVTTVWFCPDIKMATSRLRLGDVEYLSSKVIEAEQFFLDAPEQVKQCVAQRAKERPNEAIAVVHTHGHPRHLVAAGQVARQALEFSNGFLSIEIEAFHPTSTYPFLTWSRGSGKKVQFDMTGAKAHCSLLLLTVPVASDLHDRFERYLAVAVAQGRPAVIREKVRRAVLTFRKASFHSGCGEHTEALGALWRACESMLGGLESRDRGAAISRRLSALLVEPSGRRGDETSPVLQEDLLDFARRVQTGLSGTTLPHDTRDSLLKLLGSPSADDWWIAKLLSSRDAAEEILDWMSERHAEDASLHAPDPVRATETLREVRAEIEG